MELFIISIRYKIKYRNTLRNKGQLRQLCDKNQIKTIAIKSSVKASESIKLAPNWKSGSGENNDFITLLQISISSNDFKSRENRAIFLEKLYCQKKKPLIEWPVTVQDLKQLLDLQISVVRWEKVLSPKGGHILKCPLNDHEPLKWRTMDWKATYGVQRWELITKFPFTQNLRSLQHFLCRISELLWTSDSYVPSILLHIQWKCD